MAAEKNNKIVYRSEMARIAIKSDIRTSKLSASGHFVKNKIPYWSKMARNAIESEFRTSKIDAGGHFFLNFQKNKNFILI